MARSRVKFRVRGGRRVERVFAGLPRQMAKEIKTTLRRSTNEASKLVLDIEKPLVPVRTASLKKSLGRKVIARRKGAGYIGIVGPRRDPSPKRVAASEAAVAAGQRKRALKGGRFRRQVKFGGRTILVHPSKTAHLVEGGRRAIAIRKKRVLSDGTQFFGRKVAAAPAKPFRKPALDRSKAKVEQLYRHGVESCVAMVARKR